MKPVATAAPVIEPQVIEPQVIEAQVIEAQVIEAQVIEPEPAAPEGITPDASADAGPALTGIAAAVANAAVGKGPERDRPAVSFTSSGGSSVSGRMNDGTADQSVKVHTAEDGTSFWGPLDNESSRAKAAGQTLIIDQWECIDCGTCVENTDAVFVLPEEGKAVPYRQEGPMDLIQDAIDACPVTCIHWAANPKEFEQLNDEHGNKLT
jgi:ferredoxin